MKIPAFVLAPAAAVLGAGCATSTDTQQTTEVREQPEYRTGSNLPMRAPKQKTQEERERAAQEAEQAKRDAEKLLRAGS